MNVLVNAFLSILSMEGRGLKFLALHSSSVAMALEVQYKLLHLPFASVPQNPWRDGDFNPTLIFHGAPPSQML